MTSFERAPDEDLEEACVAVAELVEDHHGATGADSGWDEIRVLGIAFTTRLTGVFRDIGAVSIELVEGGFLCHR